VLSQATLDSVPRSLNDPITNNAANITTFFNMLVAAHMLRLAGVDAAEGRGGGPKAKG
jgi:hypothetical protein